MARALIIIIAVLVAFLVYAVIDAILIDKARIRGLPRALWVIICFITPLGGILWFFVGRGRPRPSGPGGAGGYFGPSRTGPTAPDDDADFLQGLNNPHSTEPRPGEPRLGDDGPGSRA